MHLMIIYLLCICLLIDTVPELGDAAAPEFQYRAQLMLMDSALHVCTCSLLCGFLFTDSIIYTLWIVLY